MIDIKFEDFITEEMITKKNELRSLQHKERMARLNLHGSDYKTSKIVDGEYTEAEIEVIKANRSQWRQEVRLCEQEIPILKLEVDKLFAEAKQKYQEELNKLQEQFLVLGE